MMNNDYSGQENEARRSQPNPEREFTRRGFLKGAGAGAGAIVLGGAISATNLPKRRVIDPSGVEKLLDYHRLAPTRSASPSDGTIFVLLTLYGGNDGLNTVVPLDDPAYVTARGTVALDPSSLLPISSEYGLHASMTGFKSLWDQGKLAIIHGVGYPNANLSHFASMDIWQSGGFGTNPTTGWLGRWLDLGVLDPLQSIVIGPVVPLALMGEKYQASSILPPPIDLPGSAMVQSVFAKMQASDTSRTSLMQDVADAGRAFLPLQSRLAPVLDLGPLHSNLLTLTGGSPSNIEGGLDLAQGGGSIGTDSILVEQFDLVAAMIQADLPG